MDSAIHSICCLLNVPPWQLGIMTTSKGLVAGPLSMTTLNNEVIDCMSPGGTLIPQDVIFLKNIKSSAKYVLLIEKDAAFQKLLDEDILIRLPGCLLMTGKGYPDINTRLLIKNLNEALKMPVFALVDADPHGITIMCTYRFGSLNMCNYADFLAVPNIKWLGIHPSDILELNIPTSSFTKLDKQKLTLLANKPFIVQNKQIQHEVAVLMELGKKAEIENVKFSSSYLTDVYIPTKLSSGEFY